MKKKGKKTQKKASFSINKKELIKDLQIKAFFIILILFLTSFAPVVQKTSYNVKLALTGPRNSFPIAKDREPLRVVRVVATAYSSDVWQTDSTPCIPASGYDLCAHYEEHGSGDTVAANFLPLGSKVKLPALYGDKMFTVRDRMNKRYGEGRIDVWLPSRKEAVDFGVKYLEMEYYGGGSWRVVKK